MSRDLLDDLLADVPRHVTPDPGAAWRAGTTRRRRRYGAELVAVTAAVALVGLGLVRLHDRAPVEPVGHDGVQGHPSVVLRPTFLTGLPERPGPLVAAFVQETESEQAWIGVSADGRTWRLPGSNLGAMPSLSRDGTWLMQVTSGTAALRLTDLVTGHDVPFPMVGHADGGTPREYDVLANRASYWSPDGTRVVVAVWHPGDKATGAIVLGTDGSLDPVEGRGSLRGWQGDDHLVWQRAQELIVTDASGEVVTSRVQLQATHAAYANQARRFALSDDGTRLAVVQPSSPYRLDTYSATTGEQLGESTASTSTDPIQILWQGDRVLGWTSAGLVDLASGRTVVGLSDRWDATSSTVWASDGLRGPVQPAPGVAEWRYWPFLWWWRQLLGGAAAVVIVAGVWWFDRRDRHRLRAAA